jgi:hypothetical protein
MQSPTISTLLFSGSILAIAFLNGNIARMNECDQGVLFSVTVIAISSTLFVLKIQQVYWKVVETILHSKGTVEDIVDDVEAEIDPDLSPAENAVKVLNFMLCHPETSKENKIRLLYCIEVLSKRSGELFVPHGLLESNACKIDNDGDCDDSVHEWLISQFSEVNPNQNPESVRSNGGRISNSDAVSSIRSTQSGRGLSTGDWAQNVMSPHIEVSPKTPSPMARKASRIFGKGVLFNCSVTDKEIGKDNADFLFSPDPEERRKIEDALQGVDEWGWDVFKLCEACSGRVLQNLGLHLLIRWDLISKLDLKISAVQHWLSYVESSYTLSEYHNATHAADVLQTVHFMLSSAGVAAYLNDIEIFAILVAAMIHDVGHDGFTNSYHKHLLTDRALSFNDQSIQENFHVWKIFSKMAEDQEINIFQTLSADQFVELRRLLIMMILSTDMSKHFSLHNDFKLMLESKGRDPSQWSAAGDAFMCFLLHTCDISAQSKPHDLAMAWYPSAARIRAV